MSSPKTSVIVHPAETPLVILRADYLRICNGLQCEAILLNVFEHWRNSVGEKWIYRTIDQLVDDMCGLYKYSRVKQALEWLVAHHRIKRRHNPERKNDRTYQYWFNTEYVQALIDDFYPNRYFQRLEPLFSTVGTVKSNETIQETLEDTHRDIPAGADDGSEKREGEELPSFQESEQDVPKESQPDYEKRPWLYSRDSVSNDCFSGLNKVDQNTAIFNTVCYHIFGFTTSPHDHPRKSLEGKSASYIRKSIPDITPQRIQSAFEYYRATNKYADKLKDRDKMVSIIKDFERGNSAVVSGDPTTWTDDSHPTEEQCRQREDWTKLHKAWCVATGKPAWQALKHSETKLRYDATHYRESVQ